MPKCKNEVFLSKVGIEKLNNQVEIDYEIADDLTDCKKINTKKYYSTEATGSTYAAYAVPSNQFECMKTSCVNSGTLYNNGAETVYKIDENGEEYAAGVVTFYVTGAGSSATIKLSEASTFTNADSYTVDLSNISAGADGYKAVIIDLSQTATVIGDGWTPSVTGTFVSITITGGSSTTGISSIALFDEMEDFAISNVIKMACLQSIDNTWAFDMAEASCFSGGYDIDAFEGFDVSITGRAITPNFMFMNPLAKKGKETESWTSETIQATAEANGSYAQVILSDMYQPECRFISIQRADLCTTFDSQLHRLSIPTSVALEEDQFILIDNGDGTTTVLLNAVHAGKQLLISYPKKVNVEEWVFTKDRLDSVRGALSYVKCYKGAKYRFVYDNAYVTSISDSISTDAEQDIEVQFSIRKDAQGRFGRAYRILD